MKCNFGNVHFVFLVRLRFRAETQKSQVWFLHCRDHTGSNNPLVTDRCPFTAMSKPLTTLNLHSFLQLMDAPLVVSIDPRFQFHPQNEFRFIFVTLKLHLSHLKELNSNLKRHFICLCCQMEVFEDPSTALPPPVPYQHTPQLFLFSHPGTAHNDMDTATSLAWKLRGFALVVLVHRCID